MPPGPPMRLRPPAEPKLGRPEPFPLPDPPLPAGRLAAMTGASAGRSGTAVATVAGGDTGAGSRLMTAKHITTPMRVRTPETIQAIRSFWFFMADLYYSDAVKGVDCYGAARQEASAENAERR
jgi:hypothetical protein